MLRSAAALYLQSEGSAAAKRQLAQYNRQERQKAPRANWEPGHDSFQDFDELKRDLQNRIANKDGPDEVWALLSSGFWGDDGQRLIYLEDGKARAIRAYGQGRVGRSPLTAEQMTSVRGYVERYGVDDLPALELPIVDGIQYNYVHATPSAFHRVFMNNPPVTRKAMMRYEEAGEGIVVYGQLVNLFTDLFDSLDLEISYGDGTRLLIPRETARVETVWNDGEDRRVFVADRGATPQWRTLKKGELGEVTDEPEAVEILASERFLPAEFDEPRHNRAYPWHSAGEDGQIRAGTFRKQRGLWRLTPQGEPALLFDRWSAKPIVSADGQWCLVAHVLDDHWGSPNGVMRLNLKTGEQFPVELEPADTFEPVAFLEAHGKFLVHRKRDKPAPGIERDAGPENAEFHLIDPQTGQAEKVAGEFFPLFQQTFRPLQSTGEPHEFWAAQMRRDPDGGWRTEVGRYDARKFRFSPLTTIDGIAFDSMQMWVDEPNRRVDIAVNGDLITVPLE